MKTKDQRKRYVIQHRLDGYFLNVLGEKTHDFMKATRWHDEYEINDYLTGRYKPENPDHYRAVPVIVTYELEDECHGEQGVNGQAPSAISS